jgi:hypothetical protein
VYNTNGNDVLPKGTIVNAMSTVDQWWEPPMQCQDEVLAVYRGARPGNIRNAWGPMMICGWGSMMDQYNIGGSNTIDDGNQMTDSWQVFGDISVVLFNKNAGALSCNHDNTLFNGNTTFTLTCNETDADLALSYQGKTLATTKSNGGTAVFTFTNNNLIPGDSATITATKFNFKPYQKKVEIIGWPASNSDVNANAVSISPNPTSGKINISGNKNILAVTICDVQGHIVLQQKVNSVFTCTIDASQLTSGMYYVQTLTASSVATQKIIKY